MDVVKKQQFVEPQTVCFQCGGQGAVFFPAVGYRTQCPCCKGSGRLEPLETAEDS